jgi:hypothetical protein
MDTQFHSQRPSVMVIIKDPEGIETDVTCHIFLHAVRRNDDSFAQFRIEGNVKAGLGGDKNLQQHTEIQDRKKNKSLMEIDPQL